MTKYAVELDLCLVTLDGHIIYAAQTADDAEGIVTAPLIDSVKGIIFDHGREDYAVVERKGRVTITPLHKKSPSDFFVRAEDFLESAGEDYPFLLSGAREGELDPTWDQPRPWVPDKPSAIANTTASS
jgi:hypothetical protein